MKTLAANQWNREKAAHLLVRSGFGATPEQIAAAAARSMAENVEALFNMQEAPPPAWVTPESEIKMNPRSMMDGLTDEERRKLRQIIQREHRQHTVEMVGWWVERMITPPCPLQEKMALFWHGHFATSIRKVRIPYMMYLQNQTFRSHAFGNWQQLITAVSQDPAMLVYLDNTQSKAGAPNENYARELMELFTLGEGHYTEQDIKEAARALTGWVVDPRKYAFLDTARLPANIGRHDDSPKTFFGQTGNFDGHDVIRIILEQDQAARFITAKLWTFFAYENPEPEVIDALAKELRDNNYELKPLIKRIFTSEAFYSEKALRQQIKSPAQWLAGSCIALGVKAPPPRMCQLALQSLGQELFAPPNVKGWDGGYAWITTASLTARYNLAQQLINSRPRPVGGGFMRRQPAPYTVDTAGVLPHGKRDNPEAARAYLEERIYQTRLSGDAAEQMNTFFKTQPPPEDWTDAQMRNILHVMMSTPQYQLT
jgi:uncharacterized protein (DUF1800 family)